MKRFISLISFFVIISALSLFAQPKLEITGGDVVDWKDVSPKDNPLVSNVEIKNTGTELLKISEVKPTCGCTTAPLGKYDLEPGESTIMKVTLNVGSASGKLHKTIRISSNDPAASMKTVSLKANLIRPIEIKPTSYFNFNQLTVGSEASSKLFLKNTTKESITISDFQVEPNYLKIDLKGKVVLKPGEEVELNATIKPDKAGYVNASVKMKTSNSEIPELDIRGYGNVKESPIFNSK